MKYEWKDSNALLELGVVSLLYGGAIAAVTIDVVGYFLASTILGLIVALNLFKLEQDKDLSVTLVVPILLSAFQNMMLGFCSEELSKNEVQVLTIMNFAYSSFFCFCFYLRKYKNIFSGVKVRSRIGKCFVYLCVYSVFSIALLRNVNAMSIASSFRNMIAMFLFFFLGALAADSIIPKRVERLIIIIGLIVICIGIFEVFFYNTMWIDLNITDLWTKKGIRLQDSGLPTNFYSSETINGHRIRRMTASFADPVNLGAFLFVVFALSLHHKFIWGVALSALAIVLTVSKGAMLGMLVFFCVYAYFYLGRSMFMMILGGSGMVGLGFLLYAAKTSAASVFMHISGLLAAFKSLPAHPLGSGIGSNGVLAKQFSSVMANADVTETGLGMIIAQLGFVGLLIYTAFFVCCGKLCARIDDKGRKTLAFTFLFSIVLNVFFNEVALSPNSCAAYFLIIGYSTIGGRKINA